MLLRPLTVDDQLPLEQFTCARLGEPWTEVIQETVRDHLSDQIAAGRISALGLFDNHAALRGVAAWRITELTQDWVVCRVDVIAVAVGTQRQGYGRQLKEAVVAEAQAAGARAVDSIVHRRNVGMLRLNRELGAVVDAIQGEANHLLCVIPIRAD